MSKTARKRYWRKWKSVDVAMMTAPEDFKKIVLEWAQQNEISIVIRTNSVMITHDPIVYNRAVWRCFIQKAECATMFALIWGV